MADSSTLASILSGNDPLAPQMVPAYVAAQQTQQMLDPNYGMNQGPFGALARVLAGATGYGQGGLLSAVQNVTDARIAAQPEQAKLLASPDPYSTLAANPDAYSPLARSTILNGATPGSVAEARLRGAQALYNTAQAGLANASAAPMPPMYGGTPSTGGGPARGGVPGASANPGVLGTGRPQAAAEPDFATIAAMPPQQQAIAVARMTPQQKAALAALIARSSR
jgi:hypothetical protein